VVIRTEVFWWLMESSDVKVVGIKNTETLMWPRDGNFIFFFVMETKCSWWKPNLRDENQIFVMETKSSWRKPNLRDGNQIFVMKTKSSWWKLNLRDGNLIFVMIFSGWKFKFLGDESLIFSVMKVSVSRWWKLDLFFV